MTDLDLSTLAGLGMAVATGSLIGLERGWQQREIADGHRVAGVRTFALLGVLGGLGHVLAQTWGGAVLAALAVLVGLLLLAGYVVTVRMHTVMGLTTYVAALLTFAIGAIAASGAWRLAAVAAVVVTALLQFKRPLHAGIGKLSEVEMASGTQLLLISVVALPVLPDQGFGPYQVLNPYRLWWAVVLLSVLSFLGFVLMRWLGTGRGLTLTALLGGLVSSTATTASLARWSHLTPALRPAAATGAVLACSAMFARMAVLIAIAAPALGRGPVWVFGAMGLAGAAVGAVTAARRAGEELPDLKIGNPLKLSAAIQFAAFLGAVTVAGRLLSDQFGDAGLLVTSAVSGLVDVDAITLSVGRMVAEEAVGVRIATLSLFIAATVNQLTKLVLAVALDGRSLSLRILPAFAFMGAVGLGVAMIV